MPEDEKDNYMETELNTSLHIEITQRLRQKILTGELPPRSRILERELSESFDISRTPLREAIKVLASEELVILQPHRGSVVAPLEAADINENYEVLEALEETVGALAARRASDHEVKQIERLTEQMLETSHVQDIPTYLICNHEIHRALVSATHNPTLEATYTHNLMKTFRACFISYGRKMLVKESISDHERILHLLKQRDGDALGQALLEHCRTVHRKVVKSLAEEEQHPQATTA